MEHVDEGTIHAWLDGALSAGEGERLEAHVAACTDCAAAVAEARGLIAASSRILSALDEVPGGVLPKRVDAPTTSSKPVVAGGGAGSSAPAAGERGAGRRVRPWWQRPQFAAAAGIAFVAVAVSVVWQRSPRTSLSELAADRASEPAMAPLGASAPATIANTPPAAPPAAPVGIEPTAPSASKTVVRADAAADSVSTNRDATERRIAPLAAPASAVVAPTLQAVAPSKEREEAKRVTGSTAPAAPNANPRDAATGGAAATARAIAPAKAVGPARTANEVAAAPAPPVTDTTGRRNAPVLAADAITRAERERVTGEVDAARRSAVADAAAEGVMKKATASTENVAPPTPGQLAGCYQLQGSPAARKAGVSESVELLASGAGEDQTRPAYLVRLLPSGTTKASGGWRWSIVPGVGLALVRGTAAEAPRFTFAVAGIEGRTRAVDVPRAVRIDCPAR